MKIAGATMTCREIVELVTDYVEGAMRGEDRAVFEQHLAACRICKDYVREVRTTVSLAGSLRTEDLEATMPEETKQALLGAFRSFRERDRGGDR